MKASTRPELQEVYRLAEKHNSYIELKGRWFTSRSRWVNEMLNGAIIVVFLHAPDIFFSTSLSTRFPSVRPSGLHFRTDWLSRLGLSNQVDSTTDHLTDCYLPSTPKDRSTMKAELTE